MTKEVQFRRGSTADHVSGVGFTGALAEVTVDTTNNTLRVHDGSTKGGHELVGVAVTQRITNKEIDATRLNVSGFSSFSGVSTFYNITYFPGDPIFGIGARFQDDSILGFGDANSWQFYYDGINPTILNEYAQPLLIASNKLEVKNALATETGLIYNQNGAIELYYDNTKEFETTGFGATVFGTFESQQLNITGLTTFSGIVTSTSSLFTKHLSASGVSTFSGIVTSTSTLFANQLSVLGPSTFVSGPVIIGTGSSTGTAGQILQIAGINSSVYIGGALGIGTTNPTAELHLPPGSATANTSPLKFAAGPLLTVPEIGAVEFDGDVFYGTGNAANGRMMLDATNYYRLNANRNPVGSAITNYFGNTGSTLTITPNGIYQFEYHLFFTKTTAGTVTYTLLNTTTVTNLVAMYEHSNFAGITTTADASAVRGVVSQTAASVALPVTPSLISGSNHYANIRVLLENGNSTGMTLRVTASAGTITPLRGSWYSVRELPSAVSVGIFT